MILTRPAKQARNFLSAHGVIEGVKVHDTNFTGIWLWDVKDSRIAHTDLVNCSWGSTDYCVGALNLGNLEVVIIRA